MSTLLCRGKLHEFDQPLIMGIINATPDSFYRSDIQSGTADAVELAGRMLSEGADILDIGGQSTRPGAERISSDQELARVVPVIREVAVRFPEALISVDSFYSEVARAALENGAAIINDVSGGDDEMIAFAAESRMPYILTHSKKLSGAAEQELAVITEIFDYMSFRIDALTKTGINDIIIDPGFGFHKNAEQNFQLLRNLSALQLLGKPILAGLSRKRTIWQTLEVSPAEALNGTTVLNTIALQNGANILRVHDVKEAAEARKLVSRLLQ